MPRNKLYEHINTVIAIIIIVAIFIIASGL